MKEVESSLTDLNRTQSYRFVIMGIDYPHVIPPFTCKFMVGVKLNKTYTLQATVIRMVSDKLTAVDRIQVLTMLRAVMSYLETTEMQSTGVAYDEPLVIVRDLVVSVEEMHNTKLNNTRIKSQSR